MQHEHPSLNLASLLSLSDQPTAASDWINAQPTDSFNDLSSLLTSLLLLQSDIQTEQAALSLQLINAIPQLSPTIQLARRHVQATLAQLPFAEEADRSPVDTLRLYQLLSTNLNATSQALERHQKWLSIQTDVTDNLDNLDLCTTLLADALVHSSDVQKSTLDPLCDTVADKLCREVRAGLDSGVYDTSRTRVIWQWCVKIERKEVFEDAFRTRSSWYVDAYKTGGFEAVSECLFEDAFLSGSLVNTLLTAFVSELTSVFQREIRDGLRGFYVRVEGFITSVDVAFGWSESLLQLFIEFEPTLPQHIDTLQSLMRHSDDLLDWTVRFMHGLALNRLPSALVPSFTKLLSTPHSDTTVDTWNSVDLICVHVEGLIVFESWFAGFLKRYNEAVDAEWTPSQAFQFTEKPRRVRLDFSVKQCFADAIASMQTILLAPVRPFIDSASHSSTRTDPLVSISTDAKLPRFSESPSDAIVSAAEYILTLPQYLDLFKERHGFVRLGEDGVIAWTYFVARRVKGACTAGIDLDYFSNVCRVIGMD